MYRFYFMLEQQVSYKSLFYALWPTFIFLLWSRRVPVSSPLKTRPPRLYLDLTYNFNMIGQNYRPKWVRVLIAELSAYLSRQLIHVHTTTESKQNKSIPTQLQVYCLVFIIKYLDIYFYDALIKHCLTYKTAMFSYYTDKMMLFAATVHLDF